MPKFLEDALTREYGNNKHAIYGTLNKIGAMKGNQETAKGKAMAAKHAKDVKVGTAKGHPHQNLGKYLHPKKGR